MVGIKKVLKVLAGFFGSLFMFFGVLFFFLTLITGSMVKNVDSLDSSIADSMQKFVAGNKVEIREFVLDSMDQQGMNLSKEMVAVLCVSPSMLDMATETRELLSRQP